MSDYITAPTAVGPMCMRPAPAWDAGIAGEVLSGVYEIGKAPADARLIIDVGAHIGSFSMLASKNFPEASIIAIEPCLENYNLTRANLKQAPWALVIHAAIGDPGSRFTWQPSKNAPNTGGGGIYPDPNGNVRGVRLSDIIRAHGPVDLLKTDCEGGEWTWLRDLEQEGMLAQVNVIVGELHGRAWEERMHYHLDSTHDIVMSRSVHGEVESDEEMMGYFTAIRKEAA